MSGWLENCKYYWCCHHCKRKMGEWYGNITVFYIDRATFNKWDIGYDEPHWYVIGEQGWYCSSQCLDLAKDKPNSILSS